MKKLFPKFIQRRPWLTLIALAALFLTYSLLTGAIHPFPSEHPSHEAIYAYIERTCEPSGLDPQFVYSIAMAESSLNPRARTRHARGIMQLSPEAWRNVSKEPYRKAWDWQTNIQVGVKYLNFCRHQLERKHQFSYAKLAAAYHYGLGYLEKHDYNLKHIPKQNNLIYKKLFSGSLDPVPAPEEAAEDA
ncbi:MAG: hypothetical protein B7X06_00255 [Verrucomicrobia bacterium 21-51-4]|nr:MAG: hypothetical protein B7X06_00255 [Verrucomicrobia bacterium 21-51-4]HQU08415.1 lytic transglycosylase domain-containing protein [Opitutales bacterium]